MVEIDRAYVRRLAGGMAWGVSLDVAGATPKEVAKAMARVVVQCEKRLGSRGAVRCRVPQVRMPACPFFGNDLVTT